MSTKTSPPNSGTENLILNALQTASAHRIIRDGRYLDDERLPETERIDVLQEIFHRNIRQRQIQRLANNLSCVLQKIPPPNLLVYGPSGAGKSVSCLHFLSTLTQLTVRADIPFRYYYLDLTTPRTCFGALNDLAMALDSTVKHYHKGIALEHMQETIIHSLGKHRGFVCILIDEADNISKDADLFLTFLAKTLPKRVPVTLSYVFLTNRVEWEKTLDPRILAVLKKHDAIFEPYDAHDLMKILQLRVEKALDNAKVQESALRKIAALASRETGDARKAVEILAKAVKIAEETTGHLTEKEVDVAERTLERDKTEELIGSLANQQKLALRACYLGLSPRRKRLSTGAAYQIYKELCCVEHTRGLTQRRFSDIICFLDIYGLINAPVISNGRYGKSREISGSLPLEVVRKLVRGSELENSTSLTQFLS